MILDLTHTISPEMPVYPGTPGPKLSAAFTMEEHRFRETMLQLTSHTGTHMDAPSHLLAEGKTLDALPVSQFCGNALVLDVSHLGEGGRITTELLKAHEAELHAADYVLLYTGWEARWGSETFFADYPVLDTEAAAYLVSCGLKGVGTDAVSVDSVGVPLRVHRTLLDAGIVIVECLRLRQLASQGMVHFYALPMKYRNADGAPVRAIAKI